ncbi:MAG: protein-L-isoaspartate(D-aspartate) O-methyltransferase, partial [Planctomycetales bacterium]|nr:protein-L-isoaspartate(D-aspartate) O-methyltransferase [Planctomycetales bacterium]
ARWALVALVVAWSSVASGQGVDRFTAARLAMVEKEVLGAGVTNPRVLDSVRNTPRHEFVPVNQRQLAYFDMALPIGAEQTISSPFIVAFMTESLDPQPDDVVFEVGTGSGYQAAILSPLVKQVYSIEIVDELGKRAARTLRKLGYKNVETKVGDGYAGWPEHAPFDKIIVTCSPEKVPRPLVDQLREGGRMVIPVGERYQQTLYLFKKVDGKLEQEALRPTLFVPMTGTAEDQRQRFPDPSQPQLVNGQFEETSGEAEALVGWYYQRQLTVVDDDRAPQGKRYVRFENNEPGRGSRALQGFGVDGSAVRVLHIKAQIRAENVQIGPSPEMLPCIAIVFYDKNRREVGHRWIGPWRGSLAWQQVSGTLAVPATAKEAIMRVGLFGATGRFEVDDISIAAVDR